MHQNYTEKSLTPKEVNELIKMLSLAVINNSEYFYSSTVDYRYSKLTKSGEEYIVKVLNHLLPLLATAEKNDLEQRARTLVFDTLSEKDIKQ